MYIIDELPEGMFPKKFKCIDFYQQNYPRLMAQPKCKKYKTSFFMESRILLNL